MRIFPVLDLMEGHVVRGRAGRRESYLPIQSVLRSGSEPLEITQAIRSQLGLSQFYIADLDAIQFRRPQHEIINRLAERFPGLWLDAGFRDADDVSSFEHSGDIVFVLGLETITGPDVIAELSDQLGAERFVFSLDLKQGRPLGDLTNWRSPLPLEIAREAIRAGARNLIVLDLAQVGMSAGVSTLPLCLEIKREFPEMFLVTGGGIRGLSDLAELKKSPIDGVLIASAFHDGTLRKTDLEQLNETGGD